MKQTREATNARLETSHILCEMMQTCCQLSAQLVKEARQIRAEARKQYAAQDKNNREEA